MAPMIRTSDNAAASELWNYAGGPSRRLWLRSQHWREFNGTRWQFWTVGPHSHQRRRSSQVVNALAYPSNLSDTDRDTASR